MATSDLKKRGKKKERESSKAGKKEPSCSGSFSRQLRAKKRLHSANVKRRKGEEDFLLLERQKRKTCSIQVDHKGGGAYANFDRGASTRSGRGKETYNMEELVKCNEFT